MIAVAGYKESTVEGINLDVNDPVSSFVKVLENQSIILFLFLISQNDTCDSLRSFPYPLFGAAGALVNGTTPVICGGYTTDSTSCKCYAFLVTFLKWTPPWLGMNKG